MYAVKGNWVGQTFALATASDSAGRKPRVRRSKEERKSMIEIFIKRYQSSNKGNFPSLNLTHKEVGGSFYTVREIVREIIQENRVLGPAQFSPELQHDDNIATQDPLGSIAAVCQAPFSHTENEENDVYNHQEKRIMELTLDNKEHYVNHHDMESFQCASKDQTDKIGEDHDNQACRESASKDVVFYKHEDCESSEVSLNGSGHCLDENEINIGGFMDGYQNNGLFDETDKLQAAGPLLSGSPETEKKLALIGTCKDQIRLPTDEVIVETFPLRPQNNGTDDLGRLSTDSGNSNGTWNGMDVKPADLTNGRPCMDNISSSVDSTDHVTTKGTNGSRLSVLGRCPNIDSNHIQMNDEVVQHTDFSPIIEECDSTESREIKEDTLVLHDHMDLISSTSAVNSKTAEQLHGQSKNAPPGTTRLEHRSSKSNDKEPPLLAVSENNHRRDDKAVAASSPPGVARIPTMTFN